ncbi:MAG: glycosyltransferase family 2 protein [Paludibacteraceae bacterium]|nr:glycosyltransferase family 2 protein [Paludibacteraceae bacterium]
MRITASIVTYITEREELQKCIDSMLADGIDRIYVSDNSPSDSLRQFCEGLSNVEYIFNNKNLGYGGGHNVAIKKAIANESSYHLVINADVCFEKGVIPAVTNYMEENTDVAMVQPNVLYPNGQQQYTVRMLPTPANLIFRRFLPESWGEKMNDRYLLKFNDHKSEMNIPYHHGCFMFFRVKCFETVGLFDERFFLYPEDIDITRRMHKHFRTMFWPGAVVTHKHGAASYKNNKMLLIHIKNMIKYFNKWGWFFDKERKEWNAQILKDYSQKQSL